MSLFVSQMGSFSFPSFIFFLFCCCCWCLPAGAMNAQMVPAVYVFGDSQVDVGNNNYLELSHAKANFPHNGVDYPGGVPTGRFCNGKNSADFIAEKVGLPSSPPYLSLNSSSSFLQGVSFASGAAGILNTTYPDQCIPFDQQIEYFSKVYEALVQQLGASKAERHLSASLVVILIGNNDLTVYADSVYNGSAKHTPQQFVDSLVSNLKDQLKRLYGLSARKFIFSGTGPVGCIPSQRIHNATGDCIAELNDWSVLFNEGATALWQELKSVYSDMSYSFFDAYNSLLQLIQDPAKFGFVEAKAACCGQGNLNAEVPCIPTSTYCSNRSDHIFWDLYHVTETVDRMLVDKLFNGSEPCVNPINARMLANL